MLELLFGREYTWTNNKMHIFVPKEAVHLAFHDFEALLGDQGYQRASILGGHGITGFTRTLYNWDNGHSFLIIESRVKSSTFPIPHFSNTVLMNFLAYDHICVAYPRLTLLRRGCLHPFYMNEPMETTPDNFILERHGFKIHYPFSQDDGDLARGHFNCAYPRPAPYHTPHGSGSGANIASMERKGTYTCAQWTRNFYDPECLHIPLNGSSLHRLQYETEWELGGLRCGSDCAQCNGYMGQGEGVVYVEGDLERNPSELLQVFLPSCNLNI